MRNHDYYQEGCAFTEDGLRCGARPEDPIHLAGVVHSEATEFEEPFPKENTQSEDKS